MHNLFGLHPTEQEEDKFWDTSSKDRWNAFWDMFGFVVVAAFVIWAGVIS